MKIEQGKIYELTDGWGNLRVTGMFRRYEQFHPHKKGYLFVKVLNVDRADATPFNMKLSTFDKKVKKCHGYSV